MFGSRLPTFRPSLLTEVLAWYQSKKTPARRFCRTPQRLHKKISLTHSLSTARLLRRANVRLSARSRELMNTFRFPRLLAYGCIVDVGIGDADGLAEGIGCVWARATLAPAAASTAISARPANHRFMSTTSFCVQARKRNLRSPHTQARSKAYATTARQVRFRASCLLLRSVKSSTGLSKGFSMQIRSISRSAASPGAF
jgi:hypothetical protein